jgi:undecaprenyl-diphosphatase
MIKGGIYISFLNEQNIPFNSDIFYFFNHQLCNHALDVFIPIFTKHTDDFFLLGLSILLLICSVVLKKEKLQRISTYLILSSIISGILFISIKFCSGELRPFLVLENVRQLISTGSPLTFPSGHTTSAFAFATTICMTYKIKIKNFSFNSAWVVYPIAIFMGISRIYVGVHYPFDVLIGAIIGTLTSYIIIKLGDKYLKDDIYSEKFLIAIVLSIIFYLSFIYRDI